MGLPKCRHLAQELEHESSWIENEARIRYV